MKIKVSDYITNFYISNEINTVFTITGGFAMHLNDSFGKNENYNIYYQHHEQACAYSAVGYTKTCTKPSIVCTTAGCAATNAISPCLVAYQDSVPIIIISGQVKVTESIKTLNNDQQKLRHYAGADCDIVSMVKDITKYSKEINNIEEIPSVLIESLKCMYEGRPGPIWLSIPVDLQGMFMEVEDEIQSKVIIENKLEFDQNNVIESFEKLDTLFKESKRPLIIVGGGVKLANCTNKLNNFIKKYNIPCVVTFFGTSLLESDNDLYIGKIGLVGNRSGNFALQNCDLLVSIGCRMAQGVVGYRSDWFARDAKIVCMDIDKNELMKENVNYTLKINIDMNIFFDNFTTDIIDRHDWTTKCLHWKNKWLDEMPVNLSDENGINPYLTFNKFFKILKKLSINSNIICSSGSIVTVLWHMIKIIKGDNFLISSQGDMGFELPAGIGSCIANMQTNNNNITIPVLGEGSLQLNLQELQTIVQYKLPIKLCVFNNNAYGAIQITQQNFFKNKFGVDVSSGLSFPNISKLAETYGIKYIQISKNEELEEKLLEFINYKEAVICEIISCVQIRYPKLSAFKNEDGSFTNRPYEDMDPFMSREELYSEMIVKPVS